MRRETGFGATAVRSATAATLALAALLCRPAHADDWIYMQHQSDGVPTYTDIKPQRGAYTRIKLQGRPTATASCVGLTEKTMAQRASWYEPLIRRHALQNRLSPQLVSAVMRVESCYDKHAVSRVGARGLMQLMPATAMELGVSDSFDPEQNISGGTRYLARMMDRFNQDVRLALAAYNAGPEAVAAFKNVPPYPETTSYVKRILKLFSPAA